MRSLILFVALLAACSHAPVEPMKIDPCVVIPTIELKAGDHQLPITSRPDLSCRAVPLNQPEKADYDRELKGSDVCLTASDYATLIKKLHEYADRCGEKCR